VILNGQWIDQERAMSILDERIANYKKLINQETNPVFKRLYEMNRDLLIKLKSQGSLSVSVSLEERRG